MNDWLWYLTRASGIVATVLMLAALAWLGLALWTLFRLDPSDSAQANLMWTIGVLMLLNTAAMAWVAVGLGKQQRRFHVVAILLLAVNIVMSVTDQMGPIDWLILALNIGILVLLIVTRKRYR